MKLPLNLRDKWDEDFVKMLVDKKLERSDHSRSMQKPLGKQLLSDICHFTINDKNLIGLRIAAFHKFFQTHGSLDGLGQLSTHNARVAEIPAKELIDNLEITPEEINSTQFNLSDSIHSFKHVIRHGNMLSSDPDRDEFAEIQYYLAMFRNDEDEILGFRVEVPFAFKFTDEMLSAYHESFEVFKGIHSKIRSYDQRLVKTFKMRDGAEFAALFMYVFWDEMNETERKYVVPSILLTVLNHESNHQIRNEVYYSNLSNYGFISQWLGMIFENREYKENTEELDGFLFGHPMESFQDLENMNGSVFSRILSRANRGAYRGSINRIHFSENTMSASEDIHPLFGCIAPMLNDIQYDDSYGFTSEFVMGNIKILPVLIEFAKEQFSGPTALKWILNGNTVEDANKFYEVGIKSPDELGKDAKIMDSWVSAWSDS